MKYISPGGWFSIELPQSWNEFEDTAESFLFYNPEKWNGNFRISAFRDKSEKYADECIKYELKENNSAKLVRIGEWECAYSSEDFNENGEWYTSHFWITGNKNTSVECSFTISKGGDVEVAHEIIESLVIRDNAFRQKEIIPVRLLEIEEINSGFEWAVTTIKKELAKDFTSEEKDLYNIQKLMDSGKFNPRQKDHWQAFAMAFGAIIINEMDGMDWATVVDGKNEYPVIRFKQTDFIVDPVRIIWSKVRNGDKCDLQNEFDTIADKLSEIL